MCEGGCLFETVIQAAARLHETAGNPGLQLFEHRVLEARTQLGEEPVVAQRDGIRRLLEAFGDGLALSKAYPGSEGFRNTPTLVNVAHKAAWFHDGRLGTNLNDVTREMITETYMMNMA